LKKKVFHITWKKTILPGKRPWTGFMWYVRACPLNHLEHRVRAHVFLFMLAYYVEWHMRQALAPILFDDDDLRGAQASRSSVVAPAQRSASAKAKASRKRTEDGLPVHSFRTLLKDLATICKNRIQPHLPGALAFDKLTVPTSVQDRALKLLRVRLWCTQYG
jgi:hypothetical protein